MAAVKSGNKVSERLLSIDWGQPPSGRRPSVPEPDVRPEPVPSFRVAVAVRIDDVFNHINAYRAILEGGIEGEGLLGRSLIRQANAIFNEAITNLQNRFGFRRVYMDSPVGARSECDDLTDLVIDEVLKLQNVLNG